MGGATAGVRDAGAFVPLGAVQVTPIFPPDAAAVPSPRIGDEFGPVRPSPSPWCPPPATTR